jgi:hypothetical protein
MGSILLTTSALRIVSKMLRGTRMAGAATVLCPYCGQS